MKKIQTFIYVLLMGFAFAACQDDSLGDTEQGGIRIALTDGTAGVDVTTRSTPSELFDGFKQKFKFQIKGDNYDQTHKWTEDVIPLAAGVYDITATCGTEQADGLVEFDKPCYTGTKEGLKVNAGETATTAEISCKVTNALVSLKFVEENETDFSDAYAMIAVGTGSETNWADLSTSAYFKAGSSLSKLAIFKDGSNSKGADILTDAQKDANFPKTFAAGDHLILTLSIAKANGNAVIKVSKVEIQKVTISETIPLEWLPKPKVEATGFDDNNTLTFAETETKEAKLNLDLASALQDIKFKFDFEDEQFSFEDREYLLSTDKETIEQALGITLPAIGATEASIDFAPLVAKLQSKVDEATSNKIMIVPKANDRWSSEKTDVDSVYTFTCNKPEFSIAVQEGNVWTKTFTIDEPTVTAGNAEVLKDKLVYQYKEKDADDNAWQTCSNGLEQTFSTVPDNKAYQVRAFYREGIVSDVVDITLETPAQLPNSDMEEWDWTCVHEDTWVSDDTYTVYPWGKGNDSFWNTNNDFSTRNRGTFSCIYNCFPAVSFVKNAHQGTWAVELRNTGNGRGNTLPNNVLTMNKVAGELFIGDINVTTGGTAATPSGDNYTITKGRPFSSRPTALKFWYKYVPLNSDTWRVNVQLLDSNDNVIIEKMIDSSDTQSEWKEATVTLDYQDGVEYNKCSKIYIYFASTITTGDNMQYEKSDYSIWLDSERNFSNIWHGSTLTIDDIQLIYDK